MVQEKTSVKRTNSSRNFHFRYLELCRTKNYPPRSEIKSKSNENHNLEFFGDKFKIDDWLLINESLMYDQILVNVAIRLRKNFGNVLENVDSERKASMIKSKSPIFSKFIFKGFVEAISSCISINKNLKNLALEGLPLTDKYIQFIANAISGNSSLESLSFSRSSIGDKGCEILCNVVKYLFNIEKINMTHCNLTNEGASCIADMIKFQKIYRYSEGWKQSLRYREIDPDSLQGLKAILIAQNPDIGDEGAQMITEVLKEDVWIKIIDMEECGLTDIGARYILDCFEYNRSITDFGIRGNADISEAMYRILKNQLGKDYLQEKELESSRKANILVKLREQIQLLEEQLAIEGKLRKQIEILNEQLHEQTRELESRCAEQEQQCIVPEGYALVRQDSWDRIINEKNELSRSLLLLKSRYHKRSKLLKKVKSETVPKIVSSVNRRKTKSEHGMFNDYSQNNKNKKDIIFETGIGDTLSINKDTSLYEYDSKMSKNQTRFITPRHYPSRESFAAKDELKVFMNKKQNLHKSNSEIDRIKSSARALFMGY